MIYTPMTKAAMKLCFEAHRDQMDKAGLPYVFHPFHLADQMDTEEAVCVALLHDVMEDTEFGVDDIRAAGMSDAVVEALLLMTHDTAVPYMDYVANLAENDLARTVKMADLRNNSDTSRLEPMAEKDAERVAKYKAAYDLLLRKEIEAERDMLCGSGRERFRSLLDVKHWCDQLLDAGTDPDAKVVINRLDSLSGYTYVDDLYNDPNGPSGKPTLQLGSWSRHCRAWSLERGPYGADGAEHLSEYEKEHESRVFDEVGVEGPDREIVDYWLSLNSDGPVRTKEEVLEKFGITSDEFHAVLERTSQLYRSRSSIDRFPKPLKDYA